MARSYRGGAVRVASFSLAFAAALASSGLASAATVNALQGQVLVNSGQGYRLVDGSTQLSPGATVVANPGAIAQVNYGGGCSVTVQPGSVYLVAAQAPCQSAESSQPAAPPTQSGSSQGGSWGGTGTALLIAGGAAAAGVGAYFLVQSMSP
jgi:hypothetical protein